MDFELDDILGSSTWFCPDCAKNGKSSVVKLMQANSDTAVFFCSDAACLYPYEDQSEPMLVKRTLAHIPASEDMLETLELPTSWACEDLIPSQVSALLWVKAFVPFLDGLVESLRLRNELCEAANKVDFKLPNAMKVTKCKDADYEKLIELTSDPVVMRLAKYFKSDIEETIKNINILAYFE